MPPDVEIHGPFKTEAEVKANQTLVLFGSQCEVTEGDTWEWDDPAWNKPQ